VFVGKGGRGGTRGRRWRASEPNGIIGWPGKYYDESGKGVEGGEEREVRKTVADYEHGGDQGMDKGGVCAREKVCGCEFGMGVDVHVFVGVGVGVSVVSGVI